MGTQADFWGVGEQGFELLVKYFPDNLTVL